MSRPVTIPGRLSENPWVLVRAGRPVVRFPSLDGAKQFFNQLRFNALLRVTDAAVFGPDGEAWYCQGSREGSWTRDDGRRKRAATSDGGESGAAAA